MYSRLFVSHSATSICHTLLSVFIWLPIRHSKVLTKSIGFEITSLTLSLRGRCEGSIKLCDFTSSTSVIVCNICISFKLRSENKCSVSELCTLEF